MQGAAEIRCTRSPTHLLSVTVSIRVMSAGDGCRYLLSSVVTGDVQLGSEADEAQLRRLMGFDLTFSAPKSVSTLWAVADGGTQTLIARAHHAAIHDVISLLEREVAATRVGAAGPRGADAGLARPLRRDNWAVGALQRGPLRPPRFTARCRMGDAGARRGQVYGVRDRRGPAGPDG